MSGFPLPDVMRVAEMSDPVELGRLLQLLLGCAVKCDRKQGTCSTHWANPISTSSVYDYIII